MKKILGIIGFVVIILILGYGNFRQYKLRKSDQVIAKDLLDGTINHYMKRVSAAGDTIYEQEQRFMTERQLRIYAEDEVANLKRLGIQELQVKVALQEEIKDLKIELSGVTEPEIIYIQSDDSINKPVLLLPQSYEFKNDWYSTEFNIDLIGRANQDLKWFYSKPVIRIGRVNPGKTFFGRLFHEKKSVVMVENENPYISIYPSYNIVIQDEPKRWYETNAFKYLTGFVGGVVFTTQVNK